MKTFLSCSIALLVCPAVRSADAGVPAFGGERIGIPPLSLAESAVTNKRFGFGTGLPSYSTMPDRQNPLALNLIPRTAPSLAALKSSRSAQAPRISRESGMPIIEPGDAVDYKLTIVPPDPSIDFKMIVKDPTRKSPLELAK